MKFITILAVLLLAPAAILYAADRPNILWLVSEDNDTLPRLLRRPDGAHADAGQAGAARACCTSAASPSRCARRRGSRLISGMYPVDLRPGAAHAGTGQDPVVAQGLSRRYLRAAGYYTSNNAKTDYNSPINIKEAWNECSKTGPLPQPARPAQPFFSVFNHEVTHESCLFPEKDCRSTSAHRSGQGAHSALPARHAGDPRRLGAVLQPPGAARRADRRQAARTLPTPGWRRTRSSSTTPTTAACCRAASDSSRKAARTCR